MTTDPGNEGNTQGYLTLSPGTTVSHYMIVEKIGAGGMGEVYLADDTRLRRQVALKFLPVNLAHNEEFKKRFLREARAAAALNHANIITIHDVDEIQGRPYIVMEYLPGKTLKEWLRDRTSSSAEVANIAIQIASGLDGAHKSGIVHRDIKSDNILIDDRGAVKILDFGLAKADQDADLTRDGTALGTMSYMSPEQAQGKPADNRSDLFSFGVVLYELLSGHLPFRGEHIGAIVNSIINNQPEPLSKTDEEQSEELIRITQKLLEKNPSDRYQNASDALGDLRRLGPEPVRVSGKSTLIQRWSFYGLSVIVIGFLIIKFMFDDPKISGDAGRTMIAVLPFENLGPAEDEYFAVGITDEITTQLSNLDGLGVISRTSVEQYRDSDRDLSQIGSQLGVEYVLEGRIGWDRSSKPARVRITTSLTSVDDGVNVWAHSYDKVLEDIFAVQADIAGRVSKALNVTLLESDQKRIESGPTDNMEAYAFYLQGNDYFNRNEWDISIDMYEHAVELDSGFALAYANLSRAHSLMFWYYADRTDDRLSLALWTVKKALSLSSDLPEAHLAMGRYWYRGHLDYDKALSEYAIALKSQPNNSDLLFAIGSVKRRQGEWEEAIDFFERTLALDPRSASKLRNTADTYSMMRIFEKAEELYDRLLTLNPDIALPYERKANLYLKWSGDTQRARAALSAAPYAVRNDLVGEELTIMLIENQLDSALALWIRQRDSDYFRSDSAYYYLQLGELYSFTDKTDSAAPCFDSARTILEALIEQRPMEAQFHSMLGVALAGLGLYGQAIAAGEKSIDLYPVSVDALAGANWIYNLTVIYVMTGEYDLAMEKISYLLGVPSILTKSLLRVHPSFAPLRESPIFQQAINSEAG